MKKLRKFSSILMAGVLLFCVLGVPEAGCLEVEAAAKASVKKVASVNSLTGSKTIRLAKGKKATLKTTVTVTPNKASNKKVTYKSSNKKIATVTSKGVITGKKAGTAKITVTSKKNKKKKAVVTVKVVKGKVTKIRLAKTSGTLTAGDTKKLKAVVTASAGGSKSVVWTTSNKKVATVNKNGTVKGVKAGKATITVKAADGTGKKAVYKVTVKKNTSSIKFAENTVSSLYVGESAKIRVVCKSLYGKISWKVSEPYIVSIWQEGDNTAGIRAVGAGTVTITATVDGKSVKHKITVKEYKRKYNYEVNFLNPPYTRGITNSGSVMYIKTDNPSINNFKVRLSDMDGYNAYPMELGYSKTYFEDLKFKTDRVNGFYKVDNGYIGTFSMIKAGKFKVKITEYIYNSSGKITGEVDVDLGYIDVKDYDKELKTWMQSVISKVTTASMTKPEKMRAITKYMYDHSLYYKTPSDGSSGYVFFAAQEGIPFWKFPKYEFDSYTSPALLQKFGEMIDYPVNNLFFKYAKGTPEWTKWHYQVESVEDGSHYFFCHTKDNLIDRSAVKQIDLLKWNFYKCYK